MTAYRIPFNRPCFMGSELSHIARAVANGHISGDGPFTKQCHALLEQRLGVPRVLLTTSCTHALEMSALLLDLTTADEVIVPSFTFVSTVNAFALRGVKPVFCDIRPDTMNLDESVLPGLITPRTRAIVVVHYAGVACEMQPIMALAARHGLTVVEDNAHGLFGRYRGRPLGTFGRFAAQSFHETKNIICGEGGALLINDRRDIERAEIIREKGTNRAMFFRGQVDKYTWVDIGSSYLPSDLLAAFLLAQLEVADVIQEKRRRVWTLYSDSLGDWAARNGVRLPTIPAHCDQPYHMFYLVMPSLSARQRLIEHLKEAGILAVFHYQPLHLSPFGRRFGGAPGQCPVTESISDQLVRLPFYNDLDEADQAHVIERILSFRVGDP